MIGVLLPDDSHMRIGGKVRASGFANFIDDDRLWLIDYEYSGMNEPSFELGNAAAEAAANERIELLDDIALRFAERAQNLAQAERARVVADFIAGMTDRYAAREHERLTGRAILAQ